MKLGQGRPLKIFLGGPIQYLLAHGNSRTVVASHRDIVEALTAAGCEVLSAHEVEHYGDISADFSPEHVTIRDFAWAEQCDVYVAVLPLDPSGVPYRTDGTHVEIGWVTAMGKRTVLLVNEGAVPPYSHLIRGLIHSGRVEVVPIERWCEELVPALLDQVSAAAGTTV